MIQITSLAELADMLEVLGNQHQSIADKLPDGRGRNMHWAAVEAFGEAVAIVRQCELVKP